MAMEYIRAFLVGGLICMLVQILMDKTKMIDQNEKNHF